MRALGKIVQRFENSSALSGRALPVFKPFGPSIIAGGAPRADGTWTMLPAETDEQQNTHGTWQVEQNQFFSTAATEPPQTSQYTIILITKRDFVFSDQTFVFYETRLR